MASNKSDPVADIIAKLHGLTADQLSHVSTAMMGAKHTDIRKATTGSLTDLASHETLLTNLMDLDGWDDAKEEALVDSLLTKVSDILKKNPGAMSQVNDALAQVIEDAGTASNLADELDSGDEESDARAEIEGDHAGAWDAALTGLQEFWATYVETKPTKQKRK